MNKKIALTLILGILIISPISALSIQTYINDIFDGIGFGSLVSYTPVYKQNWGHICCVQKFDYDYQTRYIDDITLSKCDHYTNECSYELNNQRGGGFGAVTFCYSICDLNGNNCHSRTCDGWNSWSSAGSDPIYVTLRYGEALQFESGAWWNYVTFTKKWRNFYIKGQENGKIFTQDSCILNSNLKQRVLKDGKNELAFDECQNYMLDFIQTATKTYTYLNQEVISQVPRKDRKWYQKFLSSLISAIGVKITLAILWGLFIGTFTFNYFNRFNPILLGEVTFNNLIFILGCVFAWLTWYASKNVKENKCGNCGKYFSYKETSDSNVLAESPTGKKAKIERMLKCSKCGDEKIQVKWEELD